MALNQTFQNDQETTTTTETKTSSSSVTSQLYLKSSASSSAQTLDRDVVLRRIRHHKRMEKARRNLQALFGNAPPPFAEADDMSAYEHKLLQFADVFSSP